MPTHDPGLLRATQQMEDETMRAQASDLLMSLLDSIPPDKINPKKYWDWALKALVVGAKRSSNPHQLIEEMRRQLQIPGATKKDRDSSISSVVADLTARGHWSRFRQILKDEAAMIVVTTRVRREQRKTTRAYQLGDGDPHDED